MRVGPLDMTERRLVGGSLLVATVATSGSLSYSLGLGLFPCRLCWYQRILMYPLVAVLAYALVREHWDVYLLVVPLAVFGAGIAGYHSYLQLVGTDSCGIFACDTIQWQIAGLTIPNQSFVAFVLITACMGGVWWRQRT